ncbi:type-F conjugative transfer system protein TraW [Serratia liquefaciens]|uniref:type-F conjugative transfer system protein TraW n=1 Tax=Serratia liquefaciens TaxID=614 RepID=UPI0032DE6564
MKRLSLVLVMSLAVNSYAADLGTWGELYPIAEPDLLNTIHQRLNALEKSGEMAQQQEAFKNRVIEHTLRPTQVEGLRVAERYSARIFDPSMTVTQTLADREGRVFARKGDVVNPLSEVVFNQTLYFIDADDKRQLQWMNEQKPPTEIAKIILVKGNIRDATKTLGTRIYFDQDAVMTKRFQLTDVPARVTATPDGLALKIESYPVKEVQ